ncbi:MarR family winged helix-turn-helix transcriptional regulator [Methanobrevibacter sp. DSM 116169]|uniref:MarR family winged helix-turn-helix transcriptional regulator n=1 Tax=Methanobrevibacter sp. DSM 116169 TaxID=3242727 RepID=UPI0038FD1328
MKSISEFRNEEGLLWEIPKIKDLLKSNLEAVVKEYDITFVQWAILSRIYKNKGCNQKTLANMSYRDGATITRILNFLETREFVKREASSKDKREFLIYLTPKGEEVYKNVESVIFDYNNKLESLFDDDELKILNSSLKKLFLYLE